MMACSQKRSTQPSWRTSPQSKIHVPGIVCASKIEQYAAYMDLNGYIFNACETFLCVPIGLWGHAGQAYMIGTSYSSLVRIMLLQWGVGGRKAIKNVLAFVRPIAFRFRYSRLTSIIH